MFRLIGLLVVLALGAAGGLAFDRHGPIGITLPTPFFHRFVGLPDSLAQERDRARLEASAERTAALACQDALAGQSASILAAGADSAARADRAARDVAAARAVAESWRRRSAELAAYQPAGGDACARWEDVDRLVQEAFR